jgi:phenylalanyl-tRNA synthetase beta chain
MVELAGGRAARGMVDNYPRPPRPVVITLPVTEVGRVLGLNLSGDEARSLLERLEFTVEAPPSGDLVVTVPPHRMDVTLPADLLEEILRIHGYDRLPSTLLADSLPPQRDAPRLRLEEAARDALVIAGLQEIVSYRLVSVDREADLLPERDANPSDYIALSNPISPDRSVLRRSILTGLLEAAVSNLRFADRLAAFELGPVFLARGGGLPDEPRRVGLLLVGPREATNWREGQSRAMDFYDAKGAVETLLEHVGVGAATWRRNGHPSMHPGRTAEVTVGDLSLGHVGELHPRVLDHWGIEDRVVAVADLDLEALQAAASQPATFAPLSTFPPVRQDLAVVVDEAVEAAAVAEVVRSAAGQLLADLALFDVYRGPQVGAGRKSLAWALVFQAPDRTLESQEADKVRARIAGALRARLGADVRE